MRMVRTAYRDTLRVCQVALLLLLVSTEGFAMPAAAADKPLVILALGDSLMAGYGLKAGESFPAQLETALKAEGRKVRIHNAGVSGDTSVGGRSRLGWVLAGLKSSPDIAIVELGANDMLRGYSPAVTRTNLDAILTELRKRNVTIILTGMLGGPNLGVRYIDEFNAVYPALAKKHGATFYPFFLKGVAFNRPLLLEDGMHPNKAGVAVMVRNMLPTIRKTLDAPSIRRN